MSKKYEHGIVPPEILQEMMPHATTSAQGFNIMQSQALYAIAERLEALVEAVEERWNTIEAKRADGKAETKAFLELERRLNAPPSRNEGGP